MDTNLWLVGCGPMGIDYAKVLAALKQSFLPIGRNTQAVDKFTATTGVTALPGGIEKFCDSSSKAPHRAIVAVGVREMASVASQLVEFGVKELLVEKPGGLNFSDTEKLYQLAQKRGTKIYIAYNRRYFSSALAAEERIIADGGVLSFHMELTEWAHVHEALDTPAETKARMFYANSTHVSDLGFFLGGRPSEIQTHVARGLSWHPSGSVFVGCGRSQKNALFSYHANWESPGRWGLEIMTKTARYIFKPLEKLQIQKHKTVQVDFLEIDDSLDQQFKPGLYRMTRDFLSEQSPRLCTLEEQASLNEVYRKMTGY